ncbi:MAG: flagellar hook-basal body protein [Desulfobacteraceae bacterium]|nr:flagellar hook-basal body protein [Desulfobacteraceae bacterium]
MKVGMYAAVIGSQEQQKKIDVIANNVANASSPGFKKDTLHFDNVLGEVIYTNQGQGALRETGNTLDVAISGDGYLKVRTDKGDLYTRAGNLTLNSAKNLITQDGWPVLGKSGPITIEKTGNVRILDNGQIFDGTTQVDNLEIVKFPSDVKLKKVKNGYFEPERADAGAQATDAVVRQGALEEPNFNPVEEMVRMMEAMRNFEAYQKTIQTFDRDLDGQLISKLAG